MSYTKHTWVDGELVTAAKMNNIENGIEEASSGGGSGGGVLVVHDEYGTLDKTWQEIHDAFLTGAVRIITNVGSIFNITRMYSDVATNTFIIEYVFNGKGGAAIAVYETNSADGYPVLQ
jgi:hypothetical protein